MPFWVEPRDDRNIHTPLRIEFNAIYIFCKSVERVERGALKEGAAIVGLLDANCTIAR